MFRRLSLLLIALVVIIIVMPSVSGTWWNDSWSYKRQVFLNSSVSGNLTNYPYYVEINTTDTAKFNSSCYDIRLINSVEDSELDFEIENNTCGTATTGIWIEVPLLTAENNTYVYIYYGNPSASDGQNMSGVWDSTINFTSVYHMAETSGTTAYDSGSIDIDGTVGALITINKTGIFGTGITMDIGSGTANALALASHPLDSASYGAVGTGSFWYNNSNRNGYQTMFGGTTGNKGLTVQIDSAESLRVYIGDGAAYKYFIWTTGTYPEIADNSWHLVYFTWNVSVASVELFVDGVSNGSKTLTAFTPNYAGGDYNIFHDIDAGQAQMDEFRFTKSILSDDFIAMDYVQGVGIFYLIGSEESAPPVDTCTCAGAGNDWEIDMSDYCNITSACDLTTGTLSFTGAGWCNCNASVDTTNLGDPGASGILYIQDSCIITID